jgi:hypothetical protein
VDIGSASEIGGAGWLQLSAASQLKFQNLLLRRAEFSPLAGGFSRLARYASPPFSADFTWPDETGGDFLNPPTPERKRPGFMTPFPRSGADFFRKFGKIVVAKQRRDFTL